MSFSVQAISIVKGKVKRLHGAQTEQIGINRFARRVG
jgi:hypothetical protein